MPRDRKLGRVGVGKLDEPGAVERAAKQEKAGAERQADECSEQPLHDTS